jgi:hypothetical protein
MVKKRARPAARSTKAGAKRKSGRRTAGARTARGKAARKQAPRKSSKAGKATRRAAPKHGARRRPSTKRRPSAPAGAAKTRRVPGLERARRQLREVEEGVPTPPSSLDMDRAPSAARSGRAEMREARRDHTETSPVMTGGDVDANWEDAYAVGDEAPGGDNPTPDQDRVDDIGKALGVEYQDNEELRASDKIADRDKKRWELDPASSEDYRDRD